MYITYTQESVDIIRELEESLDLNSTYIFNHRNDEKSQDAISQLESSCYSMYKAARFILDGMRKTTSDVLEAIDILDRCIQIDMISSGLEMPSSNEVDGQASEAE